MRGWAHANAVELQPEEQVEPSENDGRTGAESSGIHLQDIATGQADGESTDSAESRTLHSQDSSDSSDEDAAGPAPLPPQVAAGPSGTATRSPPHTGQGAAMSERQPQNPQLRSCDCVAHVDAVVHTRVVCEYHGDTHTVRAPTSHTCIQVLCNVREGMPRTLVTHFQYQWNVVWHI